MKSLEQKAREMLDRAGVENAFAFPAGSLVEIAELISNNNKKNSLLNFRENVIESMVETLHSATGSVEKSGAETFIKFDELSISMKDNDPCVTLFYKGVEICTLTGKDRQAIEGRFQFKLS